MKKMKYKVGDKVRIRSKEWYDKYKDEHGEIIEAFFDKDRAKLCGTIQTIANGLDGFGVIIYAMEGAYEFIGEEAIEGLVEEPITLNGKEVLLQLADIELPSGRTDIWECPEGYQFVDENGNVINATKIVLEKKKKEYPKTFDKCCHILQTAFLCDVRFHKGKYYDIFYALAKLIVCRDAYWKLYGEEMGLGKPWEPDYDSGVDKFGIVCFEGEIQKTGAASRWEKHLNKVLDFPTAEMRDAFYENFKGQIEECKELL